MSRTLREVDWDLLLGRIKQGKCTPFLGAGACAGLIPLGRDIAQAWARRYDYPLRDTTDLIRVAQFLAVQAQDSLFPKEKIRQQFERVTTPDFGQSCEIHGMLADLELPLYITTNYDDFMVRALKDRGKAPVQELCRWNKRLKNQPSIFDDEPDFSFSPERPVVFYLHGHTRVPESMVLTEDDYLDFLINLAEDPMLLPPQIGQAFTDTSLLFLGYRLADWNFRVVFRSLVSYLQRNFTRAHVSVQLAPSKLSKKQEEKAIEYLDSYFKELKVRVYWGTCQNFATDLRQKIER